MKQGVVAMAERPRDNGFSEKLRQAVGQPPEIAVSRDAVRETFARMSAAALEFRRTLLGSYATYDVVSKTVEEDTGYAGIFRYRKAVYRVDRPFWFVRSGVDYAGKPMRHTYTVSESYPIHGRTGFHDVKKESDERVGVSVTDGTIRIAERVTYAGGVPISDEPTDRQGLNNFREITPGQACARIFKGVTPTEEALQAVEQAWQSDLVAAAETYKPTQPVRPEDYNPADMRTYVYGY
jgi:hypothetical protein